MSYYFKPVRNTSLTSEHLQCPIRAFSNFYTQMPTWIRTGRPSINALYGPFLISTRCMTARPPLLRSVNALYGPFSISTMKRRKRSRAPGNVSMPYTGLFQFLRSPPKNGLFPLFFRGGFTRNYLNILIYPVIGSFFWLFIVLTCSVLFLFDFRLLAYTKQSIITRKWSEEQYQLQNHLITGRRYSSRHQVHSRTPLSDDQYDSKTHAIQ